MKKNMKKWMHDIINARERYALPVMTYPGLKMTGHGIMDVITNGQKQYECMDAGEKV